MWGIKSWVFWCSGSILITQWRSPLPGSSGVKKGYRNEIRTPKNQWNDTSFDLFSLISYFDLHRSLGFLVFQFYSDNPYGGHDLQDNLRSKRGIRMESEHQKTYELIPHMTYFHWFHILTSISQQRWVHQKNP